MASAQRAPNTGRLGYPWLEYRLVFFDNSSKLYGSRSIRIRQPMEPSLIRETMP